METGKATHISKLLYGIEGWGPGLTSNQLRAVQAAQNKLLRWIVGDYRREKTVSELHRIADLTAPPEISINRELQSGI